jgi:hypothetical protein
VSAWLLGVTVLIYTCVSIDLFLNARPGLALSFLGYALGNVGLIWAVVTGQQ